MSFRSATGGNIAIYTGLDAATSLALQNALTYNSTTDISVKGLTAASNASIAGTLASTGKVFANGGLAVTGSTTTGGITDSSSISTTGNLSSASLAVSGTATINTINATTLNAANLVATGTSSSLPQLTVNGPLAAAATTIAGDLTMSANTSNIVFADSGTNKRGIKFTEGGNDYAYIGVGATGTDAGYFEIATGDNGTEPIYVRQYNTVLSQPPAGNVLRTAALLDSSGNTVLPGSVTSAGLYTNGGYDTNIISNHDISSASYTTLGIGHDNQNKLVIFKNSIARTDDGGSATGTIRNDGGDLRLMGTNIVIPSPVSLTNTLTVNTIPQDNLSKNYRIITLNTETVNALSETNLGWYYGDSVVDSRGSLYNNPGNGTLINSSGKALLTEVKANVQVSNLLADALTHIYITLYTNTGTVVRDIASGSAMSGVDYIAGRIAEMSVSGSCVMPINGYVRIRFRWNGNQAANVTGTLSCTSC